MSNDVFCTYMCICGMNYRYEVFKEESQLLINALAFNAFKYMMYLSFFPQKYTKYIRYLKAKLDWNNLVYLLPTNLHIKT